MDFVADNLINDRRIRALTVVDNLRMRAVNLYPRQWEIPLRPLESCCNSKLKPTIITLDVNYQILLTGGEIVKKYILINFIVLTGILANSYESSAQEQVSTDLNIASSGNTTVSYQADYFGRFQPTTALDMVNRVPGFTVDDGGNKRGFGGAAGNVLINYRRPSTKQDIPSAILGRIPSSLVERVELIRANTSDIDLQGHPEVVNVVLQTDAPITIRYELLFRQSLPHGPTAGIGTSLAHLWEDVDYNIGFDVRHSRVGDPGEIEIYDGNGELVEIRSDYDDYLQKGPDANIYLNASTWMGDTFLQLNTKAGIANRDLLQTISHIPQVDDGENRQEVIISLRRNKSVDVGIDAERLLHPHLLGKALFLYSLLDQNPFSSQQNIDSAGIQTRLQEQSDDTIDEEAIARLEFYWAGLTDHAIQLDMEYALNILDNSQVFTDDTGAGSIIIDVPNSNIRIKEDRWNFVLQDTWSLPNIDLNYGLGLEHSVLSQTGDTNSERTFTFLKPRAALIYAPIRGSQTRLLFEREVSQLNFNDFVSAAVFEDDNIIFGNPDLRPDSTWIGELSHERRFDNDSVIKLTAFHHWISDVLDFLPISATDAVPGNIGNGRRWGLIFESNLPLTRLGLSNAQIDFRARWQESTVQDPVTNESRVLSGEGGYRSDVLFYNENKYAYRIDFRQDLEAARVSWGVGLGERAKRPLYKVNEFDLFNEGFDLTAFVETSRWFGVNIKVLGQNLLNTVQKRDRTIYVGERSSSPIERREIRNGTNGARIVLTVNGSF